MGQFSNSFPKHFSHLCEYAIRFDLSCSFCEYPFIFHCLHCSPSCFDPDSLLLAYLWLGLSLIDCISANKSFSSSKTSSRKPYTSSKQQERQKHSVEITINFSHRHRRRRHHLHGGARRGRGATRLVSPPLKARTPGPRTTTDQSRTALGSTSSDPAPLPTIDVSPHPADAPLPPPPRILTQRRDGDLARVPARPHPPTPPVLAHPHVTGLRGLPRARDLQQSPRPHHTHAPPLLRPKATAHPRNSGGSAGPTRSSGSCESGPGQSRPSSTLSTGPARGRWRTAASRRGGGCHRPHGKPCWPMRSTPREATPATSPSPGPPTCPQAPERDPPGDATRRQMPVGHHPKPSTAHTHPLPTPQASTHRHQQQPQHTGSPARHTA